MGGAPPALPGDDPLAPVLDHARDALLPPLRDPADGRDRVERALPHVRSRRVEPDEPLDGRAEDDRLLAAPAVRILVRVPEIHADEGAGGAQVFDDLRVRVEDSFALVFLDRRVPAAVVDGGEDREVRPFAGLEVVLAVAGRGMDESGARVHGHVVARDDAERAGLLLRSELTSHLTGKRMRVARPHERGAGHERSAFPVRPADIVRHSLHETVRHQVPLTAHVDPCIELVGMDRDCDIRRNRPGRRGPDEKCRTIGAVVHVGQPDLCRKSDVDRRVLTRLVLELRLGESGPVREAPAHGFQVAEEQIAFVEAAESLRDHRFVPEAHRRVGMRPQTPDPEPLELLPLYVDELLRVLAASAPDRDCVHLPLLGPELLVDLLLDGETVAVPAGNVGGIEVHHRAASHDDVFQDFVHRRAEVQVPVRVGRPVVKDELGPAAPRVANPLLQPHLRPRRQPRGLAPRQVGLHREVRAREIQSRLVVARFRHSPSLKAVESSSFRASRGRRRPRRDRPCG